MIMALEMGEGELHNFIRLCLKYKSGRPNSSPPVSSTTCSIVYAAHQWSTAIRRQMKGHFKTNQLVRVVQVSRTERDV
jgi:hypothetical protein